MTRQEATALQADLDELFKKHGVSVGTGLFRHHDSWGVAVRSQTPDVDARNVGEVRALTIP